MSATNSIAHKITNIFLELDNESIQIIDPRCIEKLVDNIFVLRELNWIRMLHSSPFDSQVNIHAVYFN